MLSRHYCSLKKSMSSYEFCCFWAMSSYDHRSVILVSRRYLSLIDSAFQLVALNDWKDNRATRRWCYTRCNRNRKSGIDQMMI